MAGQSQIPVDPGFHKIVAEREIGPDQDTGDYSNLLPGVCPDNIPGTAKIQILFCLIHS